LIIKSWFSGSRYNYQPADVDRQLRRLATLWAKHSCPPRIDPKVAAHWDKLIAAWAADDDLPLFIRKWKGVEVRGDIIIHDTGRAVVPADNSAAL
jgi:hypothetical protein